MLAEGGAINGSRAHALCVLHLPSCCSVCMLKRHDLLFTCPVFTFPLFDHTFGARPKMSRVGGQAPDDSPSSRLFPRYARQNEALSLTSLTYLGATMV